MADVKNSDPVLQDPIEDLVRVADQREHMHPGTIDNTRRETWPLHDMTDHDTKRASICAVTSSPKAARVSDEI
jgi:hypothetical protein